MAEKFDINSLNAAQKQAVQTLNGPDHVGQLTHAGGPAP